MALHEVAVGNSGIRDGDLPAKRRTFGQLRVDGRVHARNEERRDARNVVQRQPRGKALLKSRKVGLDTRFVHRDAEKQGHVRIDPGSRELPQCVTALWRSRHLRSSRSGDRGGRKAASPPSPNPQRRVRGPEGVQRRRTHRRAKSAHHKWVEVRPRGIPDVIRRDRNERIVALIGFCVANAEIAAWRRHLSRRSLSRRWWGSR